MNTKPAVQSKDENQHKVITTIILFQNQEQVEMETGAWLPIHF